MAPKEKSVNSFKQIDLILERHELKKTQLRRKILLAFTSSKKSLSQGDLIEILSKDDSTIDRVSIYRNLANLKEAGIVHEVDSNSYVFCSHDCDAHAHLLLFCQMCQRHKEVKDHDRIASFMSALGVFGFFGKQQPIFLKGVCIACSK